MKTIEGEISILFKENGLRIEIRDKNAGVNFCSVKMTPQQACRALERVVHTPCELSISALNKVGKVQIRKPLTFKVETKPGILDKDSAKQQVGKHTPDGWEADAGFSAQSSFSYKDGNVFAHTIIRKWVDPDSEEAKEATA